MSLGSAQPGRIITILSTDTKPTLKANEAGTTLKYTDTGAEFEWSGSAWYQTKGPDSSGALAVKTTSEIQPIKKPQILPTISGVQTSKIFLDALGTAQIVGVRCTLANGDAVTAAANLAAGAGDLYEVTPLDPSIEIVSDTVITSMHICMVANAAVASVAYNATTKVATGTIYTNLVTTDYTTAMVEFVWTSVQAVKRITIDFDAFSDGTTTNNQGELTVVGYAA